MDALVSELSCDLSVTLLLPPPIHLFCLKLARKLLKAGTMATLLHGNSHRWTTALMPSPT